MIFKIQALAAQLHRVLLITIVFSFLEPWDSAANVPFSIDNVASLAKKLAAEPFKSPQPVPDLLKQLSYDDYRDIRFDSEQSLWKETGSNFQVQFIHPGLYYTHSVAINTYDAQGIRKVTFSPKLFTYGRNKFAEKMPADLGFAGFRLAYPLYKKDEYNHVIVFAGASYFRAVAQSMVALHDGMWKTSNSNFALEQGLAEGREATSMTNPTVRGADRSSSPEVHWQTA
jgi:glucans biosynthesis protein